MKVRPLHHGANGFIFNLMASVLKVMSNKSNIFISINLINFQKTGTLVKRPRRIGEKLHHQMLLAT
ncbi:MAG: hypothetical protein VB072_12200 [Lentimicrobium sp.]|nr:hypothetical protein [Lentimicrobium sp.]